MTACMAICKQMLTPLSAVIPFKTSQLHVGEIFLI